MSNIDIYTHANYNILQSISHNDLLVEYINLCIKYSTNVKSKTTEAHHIFPVSIFGDNSMLVNLPMREHFNAHVLLWKMIDPNISGHAKRMFRKMANAVHKMVQGRKQIAQFTDVDYEIARLAIVDARKNMATAYDVKEDKYVKIESNLIDNKRYFSYSYMIDTRTGKRTICSVMDPNWVNCVPSEPLYNHTDHETGNIVKISKSSAALNPSRYEFISTKRGPMKQNKRGILKRYDPVNDIYVSCTLAEAKEKGYVGCSNYIDLDTNKTVYIASIEAKMQPWRYIHANAGKLDVYDTTTGKSYKIKKTDFDPARHMHLKTKWYQDKAKATANELVF